MDLKEFLLEGGRISHPHKKIVTEWVGEAKLHVFAGYWGKPKVIFESDHERLEWSIQEIDKAIQHFENVVFSPTNIMFKMNEAVRELTEAGEEVDLDDQKQFDRVNAIRIAKVMKAIKEKEHGTT